MNIRTITTRMSLLAFILGLCTGFASAQQTAMVTKNDSTETKKADPVAYELLKSTRESRQILPANFGGFTAEIVYNDNGKVFNGTLDFAPAVPLVLKMQGVEAAMAKTLEGDVSSLIGHRRGGDFAKGDGKHPITFGADDNNPIGRLVCLNDEMQSCYRIRDKQVVQVNRIMGDEKFTINILETTPTPGGKFLPRQFTVTYFDAKTSAIKRTQAFTDSYTEFNGAWLPTMRRIITIENGQTTVRVFEFRQVKVKSPATAITQM